MGTFTDTIDRKPETMRIDGRLRIAVKSLGIVVYRQESDITAIMRDDRLISLESVTKKKVKPSRCAARVKATSSS